MYLDVNRYNYWIAVLIFYDMVQLNTTVKIRRFYRKIPGIWLPAYLPLFFAGVYLSNIFRNEDMVGLC